MPAARAMSAIYNFMLRSFYILLAIALAHTAFAADALPGPHFVGFVQEANDFEIAAGHLALRRSGNAVIRAHAQRMIVEHEDSAARLSHSRAEAGITLAPTPGGREPRHARILDHLATLEGPAFDAVYVRSQIDAHAEAVAQVGAYSQNGDNGGLRRFAQVLLPKLQVQFEQSRRLPAP